MRRNKKNSYKSGLGKVDFGIVYVLWFFPQIWACKIGYTGSSIESRVRSTSRAVFGRTFPVFFVIIPFAYPIEQLFHFLFSPLRYNFYKGDGHKETYLFPAGFAAILLMVGIWMLEWSIIKQFI